MKMLIGDTGFVGSNLCAQTYFEYRFHSVNIEEAFSLSPDLLIYAGVRSEKYLANQMPELDMEQIIQAELNIEQIRPKKLVLISTIDVFPDPDGVNEDTPVIKKGQHPYGQNRYRLECSVRERWPDALIVRLPALFGKHLKKNFLYDYIHVIPYRLKPELFEQLVKKERRLKPYYRKDAYGFYVVNHINSREKEWLRAVFLKIGFTACHFTDSRSCYQFYPLERLWADIRWALIHGITLLHLVTEPMSAGEIYTGLTGKYFENKFGSPPSYYNAKTKHAELFGGEDGYMMKKEEVLEKIREFTEVWNEI